MDFYSYFNDARNLADSIDDWEDHQFSWQKAFVGAAFSAIAYEEIPQFELKNSKRAKIIPCDRYQAHISRWEAEQHRASVKQLDTNTEIELIIRSRVVITVSKLPKVIFVSFRGTTLSFADFKADLDFRKVRYQSGLGESARLHRGFFDAVLECFDEVVERVRTVRGDNYVPVYITGHSLGGAMAAIFHARLDEDEFHHFKHRRRHSISPSIACYTFGMPRYGDMSAKSLLPQPYHVFNELDAIPTLPPKLLGFADSANERCLNAIPNVITVLTKGDFALRSGKGIATVLGVSDHRMERYIERTNAMRSKIS
ncbi:MAG: lipase family protein [Nitrosomonas sp.]|nr:lipase family protein [Nitrosomonas sp.]